MIVVLPTLSSPVNVDGAADVAVDGLWVGLWVGL